RAVFRPHQRLRAPGSRPQAHRKASGSHNYYARDPSTVRARVGRKGALTARVHVVMLTVIDAYSSEDLEGAMRRRGFITAGAGAVGLAVTGGLAAAGGGAFAGTAPGAAPGTAPAPAPAPAPAAPQDLTKAQIVKTMKLVDDF